MNMLEALQECKPPPLRVVLMNMLEALQECKPLALGVVLNKYVRSTTRVQNSASKGCF